MINIKYLILILLASTTINIAAQNKKVEPPLTRILFILDGSQSMLAEWESGTKMTVAQDLLIELVDSLKYGDKRIF